MKTALTIIVLLFFTMPIFAQRENLDKMLDEFLFGTSANDSIIESLNIDDIDLNELTSLYNYKYIYVRSEFENKTFFSGQDLGINQYNITGQIYYQSSKGLNIGIAGIRYSQFDPKYNSTIISAGYNNRFADIKGLNIRALYSRYLFAKTDSAKNSFNSSIDLGSTYQWKVLGTSADFTLLLGNKNSNQFNWDIFADLPILRFGLTNKLSFEPELSFYFGNETVVVNKYVTVGRFTEDVSSKKKSFGLMNTILRIPVSITLKNIDLSAGYNFNFPNIPGGSTKSGNKSFLNISLGYIFGI
jgi:hypothetical protein